MNTNTKPPILEGCAVLPPMHQGNGSPRRHQGDTSKAKGKPARRKTADRFAVLNAFVDFTMAELIEGRSADLAGALSRHQGRHGLHQRRRHCTPGRVQTWARSSGPSAGFAAGACWCMVYQGQPSAGDRPDTGLPTTQTTQGTRDTGLHL